MQQLPPSLIFKSYSDRAVITVVLYLFFWLPGLAANVIWIFDAMEYQRRTGIKPIGATMLWYLLWIFGFGWIIALLLIVLFFGSIIGILSHR